MTTDLRRLLTWTILAAICATQLVVVASLHPTNFFGWSGDDAIYFTSAKALAEGKGYILPSIPGAPAATKYPILYPWLLSWIWRWHSAFPGNLSAAAALNVGFALAFVVLTFAFLRQMKGVSETGALAITALIAVHPIVLLYAANLTTDIPFAAITVAALLLTSKAFEMNSGASNSFLAGVLSGATVLLRVVGLPIAAGLLLSHGLRGGWRKSMAFAAGTLPFFAGLCAQFVFLHPTQPPASHASVACQRSWQVTWNYFTSYPGFWRASALESHALWEFIKTNFSFLIYQIGAYFVDLGEVRLTAFTITVFLVVLLIATRGLVRQIQEGHWQPVHVALGFYLVPVLIWDWPCLDRFLMPFLPLIFAGGWVESSRIANAVYETLRKRPNLKMWLAASVCVVVGAAVAAVAIVAWSRAIILVADLSAHRSATGIDKREAYRWLQEHSPADARIIAYEPASAYLYSERQAITPTVLLPSGKYWPQILDSQLSCMLAPAEPTEAAYWLAADDDFRFEWTEAIRREREIKKNLESSHTLLFRAAGGHARIYKLP